MFEVNEVVMYSHNGICKIVDSLNRTLYNGKTVTYYVLNPIFDAKTTYYIPVDNVEETLKKVISVDEIHELIEMMPEESSIWIENDNQRRDAYKEIIKDGNRVELIKLIKTLYYNREEKLRDGKKFHISDEKALKQAEKLLYEEFAYVLNIDVNEVVPFINEELEVSAEG